MAKKGIIERIGTFNEKGCPVGWTFDCREDVRHYEILADGTTLTAGYTNEELKEIYEKARGKECLSG